jgi:hypothetical protein
MSNNTQFIIKTLVVNTCTLLQAKYASSIQCTLDCCYYDVIESKRFIHYDVIDRVTPLLVIFSNVQYTYAICIFSAQYVVIQVIIYRPMKSLETLQINNILWYSDVCISVRLSIWGFLLINFYLVKLQVVQFCHFWEMTVHILYIYRVHHLSGYLLSLLPQFSSEGLLVLLNISMDIEDMQMQSILIFSKKMGEQLIKFPGI